MEKLPLNLTDGRKILLDRKMFDAEVEDLNFCLENKKFLDNIDFSKKVMFSHEIKSNNNIEGITDDIDVIRGVIEKQKEIRDIEKRNRIINLYKGYRYILGSSDINKESLRKLYSILSEGLLSKEESQDMGEYYRTRSGIILHKGRLDDSYEETMDVEYVHNFMDKLLEYINTDNNLDNSTEYFIKSQIMHFYFVYIHPYFDINGRTSRTVAMWYLLNNKCFPYIIFNRAIKNEFPKYDEAIIEAKRYGNVTYFIKNMLISVKKELEKEFVIEDIRRSISSKLSTIDYQTLNYILTMKGVMTLLDFTRVYNRDNDKKRAIDIYNEMILPLLDKQVIEFVRYTNKSYGTNSKNFEFKLNEHNINRDEKFLKYLK